MQRVMLVGASNLRHSLPHFAGTNLNFIDKTSPGWIATSENVEQLVREIGSETADTAAFVFDLLGNCSVRYEQFDGTSSLPFKSNGRFHLGGKVIVTPPEIFKRAVDSVTPIFRACGNKPCIIIPPMPRYVLSHCCGDTGHCTNASDKDYQQKIMMGFWQIRNDLIKQLVAMGIRNFKVMDICCMTACRPTASNTERLAELRKVTAKDGVHFIEAGYRNLANRCVSCIQTMIVGTGNTVAPTKKENSLPFFGGASAVLGDLAHPGLSPKTIPRPTDRATEARSWLPGEGGGNGFPSL